MKPIDYRVFLLALLVMGLSVVSVLSRIRDELAATRQGLSNIHVKMNTTTTVVRQP